MKTTITNTATNLCVLASFSFVLLLYPFLTVHAAAWWGEGYKPPAWIKANGGTIIRAHITGEKPNNYKSMLRRDGKYVEVEFGQSMLFDDAKNGTYTITFYNCQKDCRYQETDDKTHIRDRDKKEAVVTVAARPGQEVNVTFNTETQRAWITSGNGHIIPPKPRPTFAQQAEIAAEKEQGKSLPLRTQSLKILSTSSDAEILSSQIL